ncbi:hypothetical protein BLNAU_16362 [Blattamonas nauphoetae]|uniref:Uncharacterized protein n=1 Tax=Blattamonas nauphoetae TaxID=2049346 RepID=A0ABQ9XAK7_9EUKA|nr:hypothetical protein BLNAU_16362 [Blattamonas nauphoetae]
MNNQRTRKTTQEDGKRDADAERKDGKAMWRGWLGEQRRHWHPQFFEHLPISLSVSLPSQSLLSALGDDASMDAEDSEPTRPHPTTRFPLLLPSSLFLSAFVVFCPVQVSLKLRSEPLIWLLESAIGSICSATLTLNQLKKSALIQSLLHSSFVIHVHPKGPTRREKRGRLAESIRLVPTSADVVSNSTLSIHSPLHSHAACSATRSDAQTATGEASVEMVVVWRACSEESSAERAQLRRVQQFVRVNQKVGQTRQIGQPHVHRDPPRVPRTSQFWQMRQLVQRHVHATRIRQRVEKMTPKLRNPVPSKGECVRHPKWRNKRRYREQQVRRKEQACQKKENVVMMHRRSRFFRDHRIAQ